MEGKTAWEAATETAAKTASERYLARLARKAFLSLWSYPNVYTDEGRAKGKGDGKELCDLLVVFGNHVLIFSDKACAFPDCSGQAIPDNGLSFFSATAGGSPSLT